MSVVPRRTAETLLLLITCLWGGTFTLVKEAMESTSPARFGGMRLTLSWFVAVFSGPC